MSKPVKVKMTDTDGQSMPEYILNTLYASDMYFEPDIRKSTVMSDGTVELQVESPIFMLHGRVNLPLYGNIWVMAHNHGEGYKGSYFANGKNFDFVAEAIETYLWEAENFSEGIIPTPYARGHYDAAKEYYLLAGKGVDAGYCRLKALSHAVLAAEALCYETALAKLAEKPRPELMLGCNIFKHAGNDRHGEYFKNLFNFATIPFYSYELTPEEGRLDFERRDELVDWCEANGIAPKGHPLWFGHKETNPAWMFTKSYKELSEFARDTIKKTAGRYKGRIKVWDSMNEPHDWANCFNFTQEQLTELTGICCETVREADPAATSIINVCLPFAEYVAGKFVCYGPVFDRPVSPMKFFRNAIEKGIDFDVVGIQLYFPARDMVAVNRLLDVYAGFGKPIHITEMGVPGGSTRGQTDDSSKVDSQSQIGLTKGGWHSAWNEHVQADWMEQFYTIAAARPEIKALTWWDSMDPGFMKTSPFLFEDQVPRELYFRLKSLKHRLGGRQDNLKIEHD